ncbi:M24 family metallopeptidase [Patescibacteria group bacterium]|nr:M24 family metallopeptidase [Patescibacteria group bacterium]
MASSYFKNLIRLNKQVIETAPMYFEVGISERELLQKIKEHFADKDIKLRLAFRPIIAFGLNSTKPHHRASDSRLKKNQAVVVDLGLKGQGVMTDLTRTFFFGRKSKKFVQVERAVKRAQIKAIQSMKASVPSNIPDLEARNYLKDHNLAQYFIHGTGHGVGRKIHQRPYLRQKKRMTKSDVLKIGQVITVEPGIYLPGKFGYRIEDMVKIKARGVEILS